MLLRAYEPRATAGTLLQHVVRTHLERFLAETAAATDGAGVPRFIEREFREFLGCGSLSRGFARVRCGDCAFERLVPFSCKGRGFCPSCGGRRMAEQAAHLVDGVLPSVPVRQWVLTVPHRLRYRLAFDHGLCRAVLGVFVRAVLGWYRRRGRRAGAVDGRSGSITVVQRFGSGLELNVHFHTLAFDGVFAPGTDGTLRFHRLLPPSDADVTRLVATIARRVARLLVRRGVGAGLDAHDPLAAESLALAGLASAAVQGRLALGPCAGARVERIANDPDTPPADRRRLLQARCEGFDLHAGVAVAGDDRRRLEQVCRYLLRPPIAQERLALRPDGTILVALKAPWRDGTTHLCFEPLALLERLASLTPRPRINLLLYHGVLAPHAAWRPGVVAYGRPESCADQHDGEPIAVSAAPEHSSAESTLLVAPHSVSATSEAASGRGADGHLAPKTTRGTTDRDPARRWRWADLLDRVFAVDVLACPKCGGRMQVIATIDDPRVIRRILTHLGLPIDEPPPSPPGTAWAV